MPARSHLHWCSITSVRHGCFALLIILLGISFALSQQSTPESSSDVNKDDEIRRVLFISSYHPGFPTFFRQIDGLRSVFSKVGYIRLDVEFMDSKRFGESFGRQHILEILSKKLETIPRYDLIMVADDNALSFALDYQVQLFNEIPIVFFGINNYKKAIQLNSNLLVTGVVEAVSMDETIRLMLKLRPKAREIVAIVDSTPSGLADLEHFKSMKDLFPDLDFRKLSLADHTFAELGNLLEGIDETSAVLLLSAYIDKEGNRLTFSRSLQGLLEHLHQPLFHLWYHGIGDGIIGGKVISHMEQGRVAAEIVVEIFEGRDIAGIPVVAESPNKFVVDHNVMERYGISEQLLPEGTVVVNLPLSFYRQHKQLVWVAVTLCLVQSVIILLLIYSIHRRKIAEEKLRESEERYYALFAKNHSVMVLTDPETVTIVDANPAACLYYGYDKNDLIGKKVSEINILPEDELKEVVTGLATQKKKQLVFKHRLASGEIRDVEVFTGPIPLKGRQVLCSIIHDITDRKQLEEKLLQSQKLEAIGTLAGGIAHDFNNILASIMGYAELAKVEQFPGSEVDEYLQNVLTASERARELIAQILAYGRQDIGKKTPISMRLVVEESLRLLRVSLPAMVKIESDICAEECTVDANISKLHQMVLNLCTNAAHAMEKSGGTLSVVLQKVHLQRGDLKDTPDLQPGEYVRLSVRDTGVGIDPEIRSRIFDPYFTTRSGRKGSGLGLAVVTGIVQSIQGYITVDSKQGEGAQFDVYLPICDRAIAVFEGTEPEQITGHERVLVVDDEPALIHILKQKLSRLGYSVTGANSGDEAWQLFEEDPQAFDIVLTDHAMPGISGEVLARRMKELRADIPVVILSGYSTKLELVCDEPFIDAILDKQVDDQVLGSTLRQLLDKYASAVR